MIKKPFFRFLQRRIPAFFCLHNYVVAQALRVSVRGGTDPQAALSLERRNGRRAVTPTRHHAHPMPIYSYHPTTQNLILVRYNVEVCLDFS